MVFGRSKHSKPPAEFTDQSAFGTPPASSPRPRTYSRRHHHQHNPTDAELITEALHQLESQNLFNPAMFGINLNPQPGSSSSSSSGANFGNSGRGGASRGSGSNHRNEGIPESFTLRFGAQDIRVPLNDIHVFVQSGFSTGQRPPQATSSQPRFTELDEDSEPVTPSAPAPPPQRNEYTTVDEEIPPYNVTLHKYLDRISFDPRFAPCLRINRKLVRSEKDLSQSIEDFKSFNLLPTAIDPWTISHIDDQEFEDMIPILIREVEDDEDPQVEPELNRDAGHELLDRAIAASLLESEFYGNIPSDPPRYKKHTRSGFALY